MSPIRSYIICTLPRSGSTYLCEALAGTGLAGNPKEWFSPPYYHRAPSSTEYLTRIIAHGTRNGVFGAKLHLDQIDNFKTHLRRFLSQPAARFDHLLFDTFPHLSFIWLKRRDKVAQAVSLYRAQYTGEFLRPRRPDEPGPSKALVPPYDETIIRGHMEVLKAQETVWSEIFRTCAIEPLVIIEYEDFVNAFEETIAHVLQKLGLSVPAKISRPDMRRQADELSSAWIAKFRAARASLIDDEAEALQPWVEALLY
jgi:LPS sulfotransferase NodH